MYLLVTIFMWQRQSSKATEVHRRGVDINLGGGGGGGGLSPL